MASARETYRILALTDDEDVLAQIEDRVNRISPAEIIVTKQYLDFLEHFTRRHTHLLILDADLLDDHLTQFIRLVRSLERNCPILLVLSKDKIPLCSEVLSLGILTYLIKPLSVVNAAYIISSSLANPSSQHAR